MSYVRNDNEKEARAEKAKAEEVNKKAEKAKKNAERQGIARMGSPWKTSGPADEKNRGGKRSFKPNNSERPKTRRKAEGLPPGREQPPRKVKAKPQRAGGRREQPPREAKDKAAKKVFVNSVGNIFKEKANTQRMIRAGIESKLRDKFTLLSNDNVSEFMKEYNKNPTSKVSRNIFKMAREKVEAKKGANLEAKKKAKANAEAAEAAEAKKKVEAKKAAAKAKAEEQRAANAAAAEAKKAKAEEKRAANAAAAEAKKAEAKRAFNKEFKATRFKLHPNKNPNAVKNLASEAFKALGQYKNVVNADPKKRNVAKLKGFVTQFQKAKAKRAWKKAGTKTKAVVRLKKAGANRAAARNAPRPAFAPNGRQRVAAAQRRRTPSPPGMRVTRAAAARNANARRRAAPARTPSPPRRPATRSTTGPRRSSRVQQQGRR
jgi:hypothetical protein